MTQVRVSLPLADPGFRAWFVELAGERLSQKASMFLSEAYERETGHYLSGVGGPLRSVKRSEGKSGQIVISPPFYDPNFRTWFNHLPGVKFGTKVHLLIVSAYARETGNVIHYAPRTAPRPPKTEIRHKIVQGE
jgi:hypothetical protein